METKEARSYCMSRIRGKDTTPEVLVRRYLFSKGFRFRKNDRRYPGHPDIVLPKYKAAVFINGCFWHGHEGCRYATRPASRQEYWLPKLERNKQNDARFHEQLSEMGWNVIVVWECQLKRRVRADTLLWLECCIRGEEYEGLCAAENPPGYDGG